MKSRVGANSSPYRLYSNVLPEGKMIDRYTLEHVEGKAEDRQEKYKDSSAVLPRRGGYKGGELCTFFLEFSSFS